MTIPTVDGIEVPQSLRWRGRFTPLPPVVTVNGAGVATENGQRGAEWAFEWMTRGEWMWWVSTVLRGANSKSCALYLWNDDDALANYTGVVHRPDDVPVEGGLYQGVKVRFTNMVAT
jgi:hypothetical protein